MCNISQILNTLTYDEITSSIIDFIKFEESYTNFTGTNHKHANRFLDSVLNLYEKECLYALLLSQSGWYCKINGINRNKVKLTAYALNLTNDFFHFDATMTEKVTKLACEITEEEEKLCLSSYLKQKLTTYKTLLNNSTTEIPLYRGLKEINSSEYYCMNLESWTDNIYTARNMAGNNGIILVYKFKPENILAYKKSVYRGYTHPVRNIKALENINRENEYIVESKNKIIKLIYQENFLKGTDIMRCEYNDY